MDPVASFGQACALEGSLCPLSATPTCLGGTTISCRPSGWRVTSQWCDLGLKAALSLGFSPGDLERLAPGTPPSRYETDMEERQQMCPLSCRNHLHRKDGCC